MKQLIKKIKINTILELRSGLHIGGSSDNVEIGGIDNSVVKVCTRNNQPYIPGSSLKGKMRCLLEQIEGVTSVGDKDSNKKFEEKPEAVKKINNLFGLSEDKHPSKIIVRDAYLTDTSIKLLNECDDLDMPYTEIKYENTVNRVEGTAGSPRQTERVPAGAIFSVEFIINVWEDDDEADMIALLEKGIKALENDYLGGSGSRGYGQVKFEDINPEPIQL